MAWSREPAGDGRRLGHLGLPGRVNLARARVCGVIRAVSAFMVIAGVTLLIKRVVFGAMTGGLVEAFVVYEGVGAFHEGSLGAALVAGGVPLGFLSFRLARWIVPMPAEGCPSCGYAGITREMSRCPECGLGGFDGGPAAGEGLDEEARRR